MRINRFVLKSDILIGIIALLVGFVAGFITEKFTAPKQVTEYSTQNITQVQSQNQAQGQVLINFENLNSTRQVQFQVNGVTNFRMYVISNGVKYEITNHNSFDSAIFHQVFGTNLFEGD